jgi:hypothetical protein
MKSVSPAALSLAVDADGPFSFLQVLHNQVKIDENRTRNWLVV